MNRRKRLASLLLALAAVLTLSPSAFAGKTATTIQLQKTEGAVTAANSAGRSLTLRENMQFYNGCSVDTSTKSYAWLNLDSTKLAKVDAVSKVEFRKKNKDLELLVSSGNIFFNVTEPLVNDETMKVETSTFIAGIRGTCGWVECDSASTTLNLLEGSAECQVQGQPQPVRVKAGQSVTFSTPGKTAGTKPITTDDIPGMVLVEVVEDTGLCGKIQADSGLDLTAITMAEARRRLAEEEDAIAKAYDAAAAAAARNPEPAPAVAPAPAAADDDIISDILAGDFSQIAGYYEPFPGQDVSATLILNVSGFFHTASAEDTGVFLITGGPPTRMTQVDGGIECVLETQFSSDGFSWYEVTYYVFPSGIPSSFHSDSLALSNANLRGRPCIVYRKVDQVFQNGGRYPYTVFSNGKELADYCYVKND